MKKAWPHTDAVIFLNNNISVELSLRKWSRKITLPGSAVAVLVYVNVLSEAHAMTEVISKNMGPLGTHDCTSLYTVRKGLPEGIFHKCPDIPRDRDHTSILPETLRA